MCSCSVLPISFLITPPPPTSTLFPYTTLFRSLPHQRRHPEDLGVEQADRQGDAEREGARLAGAHVPRRRGAPPRREREDRKSTRLNSSHVEISYAVFCLKKKKKKNEKTSTYRT